MDLALPQEVLQGSSGRAVRERVDMVANEPMRYRSQGVPEADAGEVCIARVQLFDEHVAVRHQHHVLAVLDPGEDQALVEEIPAVLAHVDEGG